MSDDPAPVASRPPGPVRFDDTAVAFASKSDAELRKARWLFRMMGNSTIVDIGSHFTRLALQLGLPVKGLVRQTIYAQFCGGEDLGETVSTVEHLAKSGVSTILDYGVEAKESEEEFERNLEEQVAAIRFAHEHASVPYISCKVTGYAPFSLLEALNKRPPGTPEEEAGLARLRRRLDQICEAAASRDVAVYFDAEESWIQDTIDREVHRLMEAWNTERAVVFNTVQLYRHDRLEFLKHAVEEAATAGTVYGVKLVRGAYMEKERDRAKARGEQSPIHRDKASVDRDFDEALLFCLERLDQVAFCCATHNEASTRLLVEETARRGIPLDHPHIHFAQLFGMSDHISFNLAAAGYNASKYLPYGPVREVVPYLIRRAEENRSIGGQLSRELRLIEEEISRRGGR